MSALVPRAPRVAAVAALAASLVAALAVESACGRSSSSSGPSGGDAGPGSATAAPAQGTAPVAPAGSASVKAAAPQKWSGTYKTTPGALYVPHGTDVPNPQEWQGTKWHGDDAGIGLGEGTLSFTTDPATGRLEGTADGVLGPMQVNGLLTGDHVSASLTRKDPNDDGTMGTGWGTVSGDRIEGAMRLSSLKLANVLREGTFELKRVP